MVRKGWSIVLFREENTDCCVGKHFSSGGSIYSDEGGWWKNYRTEFFQNSLRLLEFFSLQIRFASTFFAKCREIFGFSSPPSEFSKITPSWNRRRQNLCGERRRLYPKHTPDKLYDERNTIWHLCKNHSSRIENRAQSLVYSVFIMALQMKERPKKEKKRKQRIKKKARRNKTLSFLWFWIIRLECELCVMKIQSTTSKWNWQQQKEKYNEKGWTTKYRKEGKKIKKKNKRRRSIAYENLHFSLRAHDSIHFYLNLNLSHFLSSIQRFRFLLS